MTTPPANPNPSVNPNAAPAGPPAVGRRVPRSSAAAQPPPAASKPPASAPTAPPAARPAPVSPGVGILNQLEPGELAALESAEPGSAVNVGDVEGAIALAKAGLVKEGVEIHSRTGGKVWPPPPHTLGSAAPSVPGVEAQARSKPPAIVSRGIVTKGPDPKPAPVSPPTVKGGASARPASKPAAH